MANFLAKFSTYLLLTNMFKVKFVSMNIPKKNFKRYGQIYLLLIIVTYSYYSNIYWNEYVYI